MDWFSSVVLGVLQGITEFLPVSSSGHLAVFQKAMGFKEPPIAYDVMVHLGTLLAVLVYFRDELLEDIKHLNKRVWLSVFSATFPTAVFGLAFRDAIEGSFSSLGFVGACFIFTGVVLFLTKFSKDRARLVTPYTGLLIGLSQCLALFPGVSRSGITISAGLFLGLSREEAGRFSFYIFIPAVLGAAVLEVGGVSTLSPPCVVGFIVSFFVGLVSLGFLMGFIKRGKLYIFSPYCFILGVFVLLISSWLR